MERPYLVHCIVINSDDTINVRASVSTKDFHENDRIVPEIKALKPSSPFQSLGLLSRSEYRIKVVGYNKIHQPIFNKSIDSDSFGGFVFKIPARVNDEEIVSLQLFERSFRPGCLLLLGSFIPLKIETPKKIVISDFDKTLVDTRYSTPKEMYYSLSKPVDYFPSINLSINLIKEYIASSFQPFILSASPHFYENALRDWLYNNKIFTAGIFLKDYRQILSFSEGDLSPKDIKTQGFYKLNHLVNILLMTGIPEELALLGDGFESDTTIYLTIASILNKDLEPWQAWNQIKREEAFKLTSVQHTRFLNKMYQLGTLIKDTAHIPKVHIHIRCKEDTKVKIGVDSLRKYESKVQYYVT